MLHQAVTLALVESTTPVSDDADDGFNSYAIAEERIPTPLRCRHERRKVKIGPAMSHTRHRTLQVLGALFAYLIRAKLNSWFRPDAAERNALALRALFERFGGLWIKLGQLMSLRTDMLSDPMCRELSRLQYDAVGFPSTEAVAVIERELNGPLSRHFGRFEMEPFAAASIAQVHRATLRGSDQVVIVKVRRPGIVPAFERDLRLLRRLVRSVEKLGIGGHMRWRDALWELELMMREELDYRYEAANLQRLRKSTKTHGVHVPRPFIRLSTAAIIVMEFVPGVLMSEYIEVATHDPDRAAAWCATNGIRPKKVGRRLFGSALRQLLEDNLFHADLHPGNIMLLRDNRVALIDLGTIGTLEREFLELYLQSLSALARKDFSRAADYLLRLCPELPTLQLAALKRDLVRGYRQWEARTHLNNISYYEKALTSAGTDSGRILYKYRVQPTWAFMRISRTWATLDASLQFLIPDANYMQLFKRYFIEARLRQVRTQGLRRTLVDRAVQMSQAIHEYDLLLKPLLRNETLSLTGSVSKLATMGGVVLRCLIFAFGFGLIFAVLAHIYNHHSYNFEGIGDDADDILDFMNGISYAESIVYICAIVWIIYICRRLLKLIERPEL